MTPPVALRPAHPSDGPFLLELRRRCMTVPPQRSGEPMGATSHLWRLRQRFADTRIACRDGRLVRDLQGLARQAQRPLRLRVPQGNPARRLNERLGFLPFAGNARETILRWQPDGSAG